MYFVRGEVTCAWAKTDGNIIYSDIWRTSRASYSLHYDLGWNELLDKNKLYRYLDQNYVRILGSYSQTYLEWTGNSEVNITQMPFWPLVVHHRPKLNGFVVFEKVHT